MGNKQTKRKIKIIFYVTILLVIVTTLIFLSENGVNENFNNFFDGLWFLFVTISTVGYGDMYPITPIGKILTLVIILSTPVLLLQLITILADVLTGQMLPQIKLLLNIKKDLYIFDELNTESAPLIKSILDNRTNDFLLIYKKKNDDNSSISDVYGDVLTSHCKKKVLNFDVDINEIIKRNSKIKVFLMRMDDGIDKINEAKQIEKEALKHDAKVDIYVTLELYNDFLSNNIHIINRNKIVAQEFITIFDKKFSDEKIVLIGNGELINYLFEKLIINNVYNKEQKNKYIVLTENANFENNHYKILSYLLDDMETGFRDKVIVKNGLGIDADLIKSANSVILCDDQPSNNVKIFNDLNKYFAIDEKVYLFNCETQISSIVDIGAISFGDTDSVFTYQNVVKERVYEKAKILNEYYNSSYGGKNWEELSSFKKESNISSCNHLFVKMKIIDGLVKSSEGMTYADKYNGLSESQKLSLLEIEHERWRRFYYVFNWEYNKNRDDNKRQHNLLLPFNELQDEDRVKNKQIFELIDKFAKDMN